MPFKKQPRKRATKKVREQAIRDALNQSHTAVKKIEKSKPSYSDDDDTSLIKQRR